MSSEPLPAMREVPMGSLGKCEKPCKGILVLADQDDFHNMSCTHCLRPITMEQFGFEIQGGVIGKKIRWVDSTGEWTSQNPGFDFHLNGLRVFARPASAEAPVPSSQPAYAAA